MNMERLLVRYGFKKQEVPGSHAHALLDAAVRQLAGFPGKRTGQEENRLTGHDGPAGILPDDVDESVWREALQSASRQADRLSGEALIDPREAELPLASIDLDMRGIVRWMNELGIHTSHCCDGHGRRPPAVSLIQPPSEAEWHLLRMALPDGLKLRRRFGTNFVLEAEGGADPRNLLPDYAERLHRFVDHPDLPFLYEARKFKERVLTELLNVPGESGREGRIRRVVMRKLQRFADGVFRDGYGNVLAIRRCGEGPAVLISAHMDVCRELDPSREITEDGTVLRSTSGILGADDRAGIAIALHVLERIRKTEFRGTLKFAFTVEEEIGLVGARHLDPAFMEDIDAAIVVDRRGKRDIVTSCGGFVPFCDPAYGRLFEQAGILAGMPDWKVTPGGSSDARVFAERFGIDTVNLSAGYEHEHTDDESLDWVAAFQTVILIETVLHHRLIEKWMRRSPHEG
jgi:hypothetical protein